MDDKINKEVQAATLAAKSVVLIERLMGPDHYGSEKRNLGEFTVYRQGKGHEITYAVALGEGGIIVLYAEWRPKEKAAHKINRGNYLDNRLPTLIEELERRLVLERLAAIE